MSWWMWLIIIVAALITILAVIIVLATISAAESIAKAVARGFDEYTKTMFWNR